MIRSPAIGYLTFVVFLMLLIFHGSLIVGAVVYRDPFVMIAATSGFQTPAITVCFLLVVATGVLLIPVMLAHVVRHRRLVAWQKIAWVFGICSGYAMPFYWLRHVAARYEHHVTSD